MADVIDVQRPADGASPERLVLFFHGVGSDAPALVPLARWLGERLPDAAMVSVPAAFASDLGAGRQWFSVRGVTEGDRAARVAQAMPDFARVVREQQERLGAGPTHTVLVGFSQGAIMALESARAGQGLAARIVSLAGRFALLPEVAPPGTVFHFLHGTEDTVIPASHAADAAARLGASATLDLLPATGHEITMEMAQRLLAHLR